MGPMASGVRATRSAAADAGGAPAPPGAAGRAELASRGGVVCHLVASNFAGGPEKQIVELSARLRERGWRAIVGSFRENRPSVEVIERARARGLETFLVDTRSPFSPAAAGQLARFLTGCGAEILVTHGYKSNLVGYLARRRARVLQVPMVRGYTAENRRVRAYEWLDRRLLRRFESLLCVSAATRELLARRGVERDRIQVLPNGVESAGETTPADPVGEFGLPRGARVLVAAGRLSAEKGHRGLVEAMRLLAGADPPICLVILGEGREAPALARQIASGGLEGRVVLAGFRPDIRPYLAAADLVVNPSLTEGMPNVVLEAMAAGAPVLATDVGGVGELIDPGRTGWLAPPGDAGALAEAIAAALADPARARALARAGAARAAESFSFEKQAERFAQFCAALRDKVGRIR
ncbi:MAG: glycosyltransferase [Candidatus Eisenbacteria bacterium]|uniref:Glycosyltransferase n=1 Tax=Eiseniibacteriota bacterium TaxID=2212470 RepID=A0A938BQN1_UNCEI|nr:glycosyltransferase [Candidatus Eisenbacteria bacterium]